MRIFIGLASLIALAACSSSSGVFEVRPGLYRLSSSAITGIGGESAAKRAAYREATAYCANKGLKLNLTDQQSDALINTASVDVTFECVR